MIHVKMPAAATSAALCRPPTCDIQFSAHRTVLGETISLPAPKHITSLVLGLRMPGAAGRLVMYDSPPHGTVLGETVSLPGPIHITRLILALPLPLLLGRMPRRRRIHAGLQARVSTPVFSPNLPRQRAFVACAPRRRCVGAHHGIGRDGWVGRGRALVQPVGLLQLELPCALCPVRFGLGCAVCVDRLLGEVVGASARGD